MALGFKKIKDIKEKLKHIYPAVTISFHIFERSDKIGIRRTRGLKFRNDIYLNPFQINITITTIFNIYYPSKDIFLYKCKRI